MTWDCSACQMRAATEAGGGGCAGERAESEQRVTVRWSGRGWVRTLCVGEGGVAGQPTSPDPRYPSSTSCRASSSSYGFQFLVTMVAMRESRGRRKRAQGAVSTVIARQAQAQDDRTAGMSRSTCSIAGQYRTCIRARYDWHEPERGGNAEGTESSVRPSWREGREGRRGATPPRCRVTGYLDERTRSRRMVWLE